MREIYTVYVRCVDGYITAVTSSASPMDSSEWTEIDSGYGDKYYLAQNNYFPKPISTKNGAYRYKLVDGVPEECTAEEIAEQEERGLNPKHTAPRNLVTGEFITVNGTMYKAIANIPSGEPIITGQNAVETTIEEQLHELTKGD